jgi:hypothetical protein
MKKHVDWVSDKMILFRERVKITLERTAGFPWIVGLRKLVASGEVSARRKYRSGQMLQVGEP